MRTHDSVCQCTSEELFQPRKVGLCIVQLSNRLSRGAPETYRMHTRRCPAGLTEQGEFRSSNRRAWLDIRNEHYCTLCRGSLFTDKDYSYYDLDQRGIREPWETEVFVASTLLPLVPPSWIC